MKFGKIGSKILEVQFLKVKDSDILQPTNQPTNQPTRQAKAPTVADDEGFGAGGGSSGHGGTGERT